MKQTCLLALLAVFLLCSCGDGQKKFKIEGSFKGFNQGELYVYGLNGAQKLDTIGVSRGEFTYKADITEPTTLIVVFPNFSEVYSNSAVLAQILNHDYVSAAVTLKYIQNPDAVSEYLKALMSARMGNNADAAEALKEAIKKDPAFAKYAANDIELKNIEK